MRYMILATFAALAACGQTASPSAEANNTATAVAAAPEAAPVSEPASGLPKVTKAEVSQLKEGMTYEQVKTLIGREGDIGSSENGTESISWANTDGSSLQTTFRDGKLVVFTDFGMK